MAPAQTVTQELDHYYHSSLRGKYSLADPILSQGPQSLEPSADIDSVPDYAAYLDRLEKRQGVIPNDSTLPPGWPTRLNSPLAWKGNDFQDERSYIYLLNEAEEYEIKDALKHFQNLQLEVGECNKSTFPLPNLQHVLQELSTEVHEGKGFFILRGLDPFSFTKKENIIIYLGLSSYVAEQRGRQRVDGRMMTHIVDASFTITPRDKRQPAFSNVAQPFHADVFCEVLALYSLNTAAKGGKSKIASSWTIYNELSETRPNIIRTLACDNWVHHTFEYIPLWYRRPLLFCEKGKPILNFSRRIITGSSTNPRPPNSPPITDTQAEALDAIHFIAEKYCLETTVEPGDIRFINNLSVLHARDAFEDCIGSERYLLRLWLRNKENGWAIPAGLQLVWDRIFSDVDGMKGYWELEPFENNTAEGNRGGGGTSTGKSSDCG